MHIPTNSSLGFQLGSDAADAINAADEWAAFSDSFATVSPFVLIREVSRQRAKLGRTLVTESSASQRCLGITPTRRYVFWAELYKGLPVLKRPDWVRSQKVEQLKNALSLMKVEHREEKAAQPHLFCSFSSTSDSTRNMQSLLSQPESHAFQSFLSSIDYIEDTIPADEWAAFSVSSASADPDDDILIDSIRNSEGRQALTKATKDLMSLDRDGKWDSPNNTMMNHTPIVHAHFDGQTQAYDRQQTHHRYQQEESHGANSYPSRHDPFPFLRTKSHQHRSQPLQFPMQLPLSPLATGSPDHGQPSPISPPSPYGFSKQQQPHQLQQPHQRGRGRDTSPATRPKRSHTLPSASTSSAPPSSEYHKRRRLSPIERQSGTSATTSAGFSSPGHSSSRPQSEPQQHKANLLSPSQKKANHIQSEQKRRANIRRGYAALCETVPALREAFKEEEERIASASPNTTAAVNGVDGARMNGTGRKRSKKGVNGKDPDDNGKDKIDGRGGPRSENMVLSKTIEHIQYLLTDRSSLLARLHHARASLPPGHPALTTLDPDPPWEREWKGGEGKLDLGEGDGDEGSGDEEEDG